MAMRSEGDGMATSTGTQVGDAGVNLLRLSRHSGGGLSGAYKVLAKDVSLVYLHYIWYRHTRCREILKTTSTMSMDARNHQAKLRNHIAQ